MIKMKNWKKNEKIEFCGVARAFVQIFENSPRSNKFGHPCRNPFRNKERCCSKDKFQKKLF